MARIAGVNLPNEKRVEIGLTYVFGVGKSISTKLLAELKINPDTRVKDLTEDEISKIRIKIEKEYLIEGDLRREKLSNIKRLKEISSYRGNRHTKNLPVRGQKTKKNSRTVRGNKKSTVGSGRKQTAQKT
jgi:small subunit ribosomal protein S13